MSIFNFFSRGQFLVNNTMNEFNFFTFAKHIYISLDFNKSKVNTIVALSIVMINNFDKSTINFQRHFSIPNKSFPDIHVMGTQSKNFLITSKFS